MSLCEVMIVKNLRQSLVYEYKIKTYYTLCIFNFVNKRPISWKLFFVLGILYIIADYQLVMDFFIGVYYTQKNNNLEFKTTLHNLYQNIVK